ncbi:Uma2 family endonuclease [Persephonella sp.]
MGILKESELPRYTYSDYKNWEGRWELIEGFPYAMSPAPTPRHQLVSNKIAAQLEFQLQNCEDCKALLPVDWKISDDTVVQPDNLVVCYPLEDKPYITRAPVLIFEVTSKATSLRDREIKYRLYEKEGVKYYVIVDPEENIAKVYNLKDGKYIKLGDFVKEKVLFDLGKCKIEFDFSKIWE